MSFTICFFGNNRVCPVRQTPLLSGQDRHRRLRVKKTPLLSGQDRHHRLRIKKAAGRIQMCPARTVMDDIRGRAPERG